MSWTRKLSRQGNTHILTIPMASVEALGVKRGDQMLCEQPFSRVLCIYPLDAANLAENTVRVRTFGWVEGRAKLEALVGRWGIQESNADVKCVGCGFHPAVHRIREIHVCEYCMIEIGNGIEFRSRPSQVELHLLSQTATAGRQ